MLYIWNVLLFPNRRKRSESLFHFFNEMARIITLGLKGHTCPILANGTRLLFEAHKNLKLVAYPFFGLNCSYYCKKETPKLIAKRLKIDLCASQKDKLLPFSAKA